MTFVRFSLYTMILAASLMAGCAASAKNPEYAAKAAAVPEKLTPATEAETSKPLENKGKLEFSEDSPAAAVRKFYANFREKKFKEALLMTNLSFAVATLSEEDMAELAPDFEILAAQVPAEIAINGEQIVGSNASVFVKMPDNETGQLKLDELKLRKENSGWVILWAESEAEAIARKEGKDYFFNMRIEVHHGEVEAMLERISKAQFVFSSQNGGYGDMKALVEKGFLPEDILSTRSTGYKFNVAASGDKKKYFATAEPERYGKTGKLSYFLDFDGKKSQIKSADNKGLPLKK